MFGDYLLGLINGDFMITIYYFILENTDVTKSGMRSYSISTSMSFQWGFLCIFYCYNILW